MSDWETTKMSDVLQSIKAEEWIADHVPICRAIVEAGYERFRDRLSPEIIQAKSTLDELLKRCELSTHACEYFFAAPSLCGKPATKEFCSRDGGVPNTYVCDRHFKMLCDEFERKERTGKAGSTRQ
ncbi:MAG TPA: hypothetical protein VOA88_21045 [Candidatus Dormibacteraeota bacterium]|nr:hypothetical protein [Candidatus Dormibacteraeota bacterium]